MEAQNASWNWTGGEDYDEYDDEWTDYDNGFGEAVKKACNVAAMVLYCFIFLVGVPGNGAVIWIAGFRMRKRPNMVWFLNLSVADLLCCLSLPFLTSQLALGYHWPYGNLLCKLLPSATILSMFASIFLLTGISIDRCLQARCPIWSRNHRTARHVALACGLAWGLAFLMSLPSFIYRGTVKFEPKVYCTNLYGETVEAIQHTQRRVLASRFTLGFLLPFLIIGACSALLLHRISGSSMARPRRTYRLVAAVVLCFFVCWLPYHTVGLLLLSRDQGLLLRLGALDPLVQGLAYLNSCINPILYVYVGRGFKQQLRRSLRDIFERAFEDETSVAQARPKSRVPTVCEGVASGVGIKMAP
uniref:C3a anaphylatoxin chemotactic receptor-like n=1 Tax=Pristiophorus japonicus TaxID=55135 RepID=UPI00398F1CAA